MRKLKYPYQHLSLDDLDGEQWEDLPGYEDLYQVSNYGRVKSLERWVERPIKGDLHIKERILKQTVVRKQNPYTKKVRPVLAVSVGRDGAKKTLQVYRLVYHLFVNAFDLEDPSLVVSCKDGDHLNTSFTNLELVVKSAVQVKTYREQQKRRPEKSVSSYDENGQRVKTYISILEASEDLQCSPDAISLAVNGNTDHCKGLYWRFGSRKTIKARGFAYKHVRRIGQYTAGGERVREFFSISEAKRQTGYGYCGIHEAAQGRRETYKGYQWRYL